MKKLALITLFFALSACTLTPAQQIGVDVGLQYATMKVIEKSTNPPRRAQRIIDILAESKAVIDSGAVSRVDEIASLVKSKIDYSKLDSADTLLVNALIDAVTYELSRRADKKLGGLDEGALVSLAHVHDVITTTASGYIVK